MCRRRSIRLRAVRFTRAVRTQLMFARKWFHSWSRSNRPTLPPASASAPRNLILKTFPPVPLQESRVASENSIEIDNPLRLVNIPLLLAQIPIAACRRNDDPVRIPDTKAVLRTSYEKQNPWFLDAIN